MSDILCIMNRTLKHSFFNESFGIISNINTCVDNALTWRSWGHKSQSEDMRT